MRACTPAAKPSPPEHTTLPKKEQVLPMATPSLLAVFSSKEPWLRGHRACYKTLGDDEKDASSCAEPYHSLPFLSKKSKCLLLAFVFMFRWIFEQLLKGAESLWQVIPISYSLYKHAAIKPFHPVLKTAICRAQHEHSIKVGSNTRLSETTAGRNTQEAWTPAWATGKAEKRWLLQRPLTQKQHAQEKLKNRKHTSANNSTGEGEKNPKQTKLKKIKKLKKLKSCIWEVDL